MITKFKQKILLLLCCQLSFISTTIGAENVNTASLQYQHATTYYYKNIAISYVDGDDNSYDSFKTKAGRKLIIQPLISKSNPTADATERMAKPKIFELKKPIWGITVEQLPMSEDLCLMSDVDTCDNDSDHCYKPCFFATSPEVLAFDESRGKLYLAMAASDYGTAGVSYFTFVADINKKEIKFLHKEPGGLEELNGSLSPSGKYVIISNHDVIEVYSALTDEKFEISKNNIFNLPEKKQLHYLDHIKWLNDTQFTYQDQIRYGKSQQNADEIIEYTIDVPTKKTVYSKTIKANTYQYNPGDN